MKTSKSNTHTVKPEYRTNPLSLRPGGYSVTVIMRNGQRLMYENIKSPDAYIRRAASDPNIESFLVDGNPYTI